MGSLMNPQDLTAKTPDLEEQRKRYLTECQILSSINTHPAVKVRRKEIELSRNRHNSPRQAYSNSINALLDHFAFLLLRGGKDEPSVAVALTGMTMQEVELAVQFGQTTSSSTAPRDPVEVKQHVDNILSFIHRGIGPATNPNRTRDSQMGENGEILTDFAIYQMQYSYKSVQKQLSMIEKFMYKARKFELPFGSSIPHSWEIDDEFSIPEVKYDDHRLTHQLYVQYMEYMDTVPEILAFPKPPSARSMTKGQVTVKKFNTWTRAFTWWFGRYIRDFNTLDWTSADLPSLLSKMRMVGELVVFSQLFRDWLAIVTRGAPGPSSKNKGKRKKKKDSSSKDKNRTTAVGDEGSKSETGSYSDTAATQSGGRWSLFKQALDSMLPKRLRNALSSSHSEFPGDEEIDSMKKFLDEIPMSSIPIPEQNWLGRRHNGVPKALEICGDGDDYKAEDFYEDVNLPLRTLSYEAGAIENITFTLMYMSVRFLFVTREVLRSTYLRYFRDRRAQVTVFIPNPQTTEAECESLDRTASWLFHANKDELVSYPDRANGDRDEHASYPDLGEDNPIFPEISLEEFTSKIKEGLTPKPIAPKRHHLKLSRGKCANQGHQKLSAPQHPELLLLARLSYGEGLVWQGEYPYPYIGLSRPPCFVCEFILSGESDFTCMNAERTNSSVCVSDIPRDLPVPVQSLAFGVIDRLAQTLPWTLDLEEN
ncbi:hypothetical protein TWF481_009345 [Arthrobotrys musiformis]|uniref:Uncharacterized protein n=1 Tax=Arthrobotrys musiformis TaxID=47236 RepID=A0AAV9W5M3_9PEZI